MSLHSPRSLRLSSPPCSPVAPRPEAPVAERPAHITRWMRCIAVCGLCWWMANSALHAQVDRVNGFENRTFAIVKAKLVLAPDAELEQANLIVRDGLIVAAGKDAAVPPEAE